MIYHSVNEDNISTTTSMIIQGLLMNIFHKFWKEWHCDKNEAELRSVHGWIETDRYIWMA